MTALLNHYIEGLEQLGNEQDRFLSQFHFVKSKNILVFNFLRLKNVLLTS